MTPDDVIRQLSRLVVLLLEQAVAVDFNSATALKSGHKTTIAWGTQTTAPPVAALGFATLEEYKYYLEHRNYTLLLVDGAILQFSYKFYRDDLTGHRLCYYPCPFDLDPEVFPADGNYLPLLDYVELLEMEGLQLRDDSGRPEFNRSLKLRTPVRIDYAPDFASEGHPACHLHLNSQVCRLGVSLPMSVGHFIRFVFSNFYPRHWNTTKELRTWPCETGPRLSSTWAEHHPFIDFSRQA